jgi:two-component system OmpR family sensor kinase
MIARLFSPGGLRARLTVQLLGIAALVIVANIGFVAWQYGTDSPYLSVNLMRREVLRLEAFYLELGQDADALEARIDGFYEDHPDAYAFALVEPGRGAVAAKNIEIIPPALLEPGNFSNDWLAWISEPGQMPVAASHTIVASERQRSVLFFMSSDPADLIGDEIADEFRGHVWLPLLPIALLLIGGTIAIVWRGLKPLEGAADWARGIVPGAPVAPLDLRRAPTEVRNLTLAVQRTVQRLDQELEAEKRRAAEATHGLRTPVAVLVARMDALPDDPVSNELRKDVRALSRMVTQYLTSSGADRLEVSDDARADLDSLARKAVEDLSRAADERGVRLDFVPAQRGVLVNGEEDAILLAIVNLIENAIHHGGETIVVTVDPAGAVSVRDDGPGLGDVTLDELVKPFVRGAQAPRGGAGLGLAIVDRVQRAHGGGLEFSTPPGGGAEFRVSYRAA